LNSKQDLIGGALGLAEVAALSGQPDADRMLHFRTMDQDQQAQAIRRLANAGQSDHTIAAATGLSVEMVRRIIGPAPRA
jgi:hypothetical protein